MADGVETRRHAIETILLEEFGEPEGRERITSFAPFDKHPGRVRLMSRCRGASSRDRGGHLRTYAPEGVRPPARGLRRCLQQEVEQWES
jgi:hypothetical protein